MSRSRSEMRLASRACFAWIVLEAIERYTEMVWSRCVEFALGGAELPYPSFRRNVRPMLPDHDIETALAFQTGNSSFATCSLTLRARRICDLRSGLDHIPVVHRRAAPDRGERQCGREVPVADIGPGHGHEVDRERLSESHDLTECLFLQLTVWNVFGRVHIV